MPEENRPVNDDPNDRIHPFQLVILVLSLLVILALFARVVFDLDEQTKRLLLWMDFGICLVFLFDFLIRYRAAPNKKAFMKWGWIDLLASIPLIDELRWARVIRVVRIVRVLRGFRSVRSFLSFLFRRKSHGAFVVSAVSAVTFLVFGAISVLEIEREVPGANILTAQDALWWAIVTMTTVGYGDLYPITTEGRLVASALMLVGIGLFGTLSGIMASVLIGNRELGSGVEHETALAKLDQRTHEILRRMEQRDWKHGPRGGPPPPEE